MHGRDTAPYNLGDPLNQWYDAGLEIPSDLTFNQIAVDEVKRIGRALAVVVYAAGMPRRLGGDATDDELALDKRRARRTAHALQQSLYSWNGKKTPRIALDDDVKRLGAQLMWDRWQQSHTAEVAARTKLAVTWSLRYDKRRIGKVMLVKYTNELRWINYSLRD